MANESDMHHVLVSELAERGYPARIVSTRHLRELEDEINAARSDGRLDPHFYQERLTWFRFHPPETLPQAESLVIVAVPRPQMEAMFTWRGKVISLILPPTYTDYKKVAQRMEALIGEILQPAGFRVATTHLPLKLLAVRSGLGAYGRNNICYVPGMGSFLQLVGLYSDLPCGEDSWQEPRMMEACERCFACTHRCPTAAIPADRFLLRAERCLSFHNERPASVPFPSWIDPSWHNCLEGCMHCQLVCPENRGVRDWVEGREAFSEEETSLLLEGASQDRLPPATVAKLERLDILGDAEILPRNLGVFLTA